MRSWWWLLAAIPAILVLRIAGFIGNFWTGLGIVALLAFLALLETFPVAVRRYIAWFFAGWVILFLGLPAVWNAISDAFLGTRPMTREALEIRNVAIDLQLSEFINPVALKARLGIADYCRQLENIRGEQLNRWLREGLELQRNAPLGPDGTLPDHTKQMRETVLRQIEKDREECRQLLASFSQPSETRSFWEQPPKWLWVVGAMLLVLLLFFLLRSRWGWALALLVAVVLLTGWTFTKGRAVLEQALSDFQLQPREFVLQAGEEVDTVATWLGTQHVVTANKEWVLVSATPGGTLREFRMAAGRRSIVGTKVAGPARARGLEDGTILRFERIK